MCNHLIMDGSVQVKHCQDSGANCSSVSVHSRESPLSSPTSTGSIPGTNMTRHEDEDEEDFDISVGCPSPALSLGDHGDKTFDNASATLLECGQESLASPASCYDVRQQRVGSDDDDEEEESLSGNDETIDGDDYFKPLKKLKMMQIDRRNGVTTAATLPTTQQKLPTRPQISSTAMQPTPVDKSKQMNITNNNNNAANNQNGVKSFSILDILNHKPRVNERAVSEPNSVSTRIVRPWDLGTIDTLTSSTTTASQQQLMMLERFNRHRPKSADFCYASETLSSTCSSGRSSIGSDCCTSPDIINCTVTSPTTSQGRHRQHQSSSHHHHQHHQQHHQQRSSAASGKASGAASGAGKGNNTSPLDALFQMTSKTFEELNGETISDGTANHLNLFNNRQQAKKKRKSRTAFTNHQIFELEKRFLYQKYLSPADRDEIAGQLGLSNAQVITWFQNRRAKLKRDMEELKKDVETTKILTAHKSFLENVQDLGILKKKSQSSGVSAEDKLVSGLGSTEK